MNLPFIIKLSALAVLFSVASTILSADPSAVNGVIDLRDCSCDKLIYLHGQWKFRILDNSCSPESDKYDLIEVPGTWNSITRETYSAGEYLLKILLPEKTPPTMGLYLPELSQATEIWVNGRLLQTTGNLSTGESSYNLSIAPFSVNGDVELRIKLRNSLFRKGGLIKPPRIASTKKIHLLRDRKVLFESFCIGVLLLITLYHFFLFSLNRTNTSALYLALSALLMMLRSLFTGENTILIIIPDFPWRIDYHFEYILAYLNGGVFLLFIHSFYKLKVRAIDKVFIFLQIISFALAIISSIIPIKILSRTLYLLQTYLLVCGLLGTIIFIKALIAKKEASSFFSIGGILFFIFIFIDIFYYNGSFNYSVNLSMTGLVIFSIFQTAALSQIHNKTFIKAKKLSIELEKEVLKQTADLQSTNERLLREIEQRKKVEKRLEMLSTTDSLTGAANRLKITPHLQQAHHIFNRYGKSFGLIMMDIDDFKSINDQYGHGVGDEVLKEIVLISEKQIRECDIFARWGGEEFMLLMPEMDLKGSMAVAERLKTAISDFSFTVAGHVTASFGVTVPLEGEIMLKDILKRVDDNLYEAKTSGKNSIIG